MSVSTSRQSTHDAIHFKLQYAVPTPDLSGLGSGISKIVIYNSGSAAVKQTLLVHQNIRVEKIWWKYELSPYGMCVPCRQIKEEDWFCMRMDVSQMGIFPSCISIVHAVDFQLHRCTRRRSKIPSMRLSNSAMWRSRLASEFMHLIWKMIWKQNIIRQLEQWIHSRGKDTLDLNYIEAPKMCHLRAGMSRGPWLHGDYPCRGRFLVLKNRNDANKILGVETQTYHAASC